MSDEDASKRRMCKPAVTEPSKEDQTAGAGGMIAGELSSFMQ